MELSVFVSSLSTLGAVCVKASVIYVAVIALTRSFGLRSFSKLSSYDFAMTVAIGSVVATAILSMSVSIAQGVVALGAIYGLQALVGRLRVFDWFGGAVDNPPLMLMRNGDVLEENLRAAEMSVGDLRAKLREANVLKLEQARAVIFESTGDVSVLHADDPEVSVDDWLLEGVRQTE
jgi:uncharacterized membrane protein YcaP (DUF421 family)